MTVSSDIKCKPDTNGKKDIFLYEVNGSYRKYLRKQRMTDIGLNMLLFIYSTFYWKKYFTYRRVTLYLTGTQSVRDVL